MQKPINYPVIIELTRFQVEMFDSMDISSCSFFRKKIQSLYLYMLGLIRIGNNRYYLQIKDEKDFNKVYNFLSSLVDFIDDDFWKIMNNNYKRLINSLYVKLDNIVTASL